MGGGRNRVGGGWEGGVGLMQLSGGEWFSEMRKIYASGVTEKVPFSFAGENPAGAEEGQAASCRERALS
jgi:hypothetical protein